MSLLVTGTDTDVGKTYVSCIIARELAEQAGSLGVFKPACSGAAQDENGNWHWADLDALAAAAGIEDPHSISPFRFRAPLAPYLSAQAESQAVDVATILESFNKTKNEHDTVLVEGVGGLLCPLTHEYLVADFAQDAGLPLLIVARLGLGTLNHTLLTVEAAKKRGLRVIGIVLSDGDNTPSDVSTQSNPHEIARLTDVPVLGVVPYGSNSILDANTRRPVKIEWIQLVKG